MATISLPIETKVRELFGKVWLGLELANRGHTVVLGEQNAMNEGIDRIKPDVHFGDSISQKSSRITLFETLQAADARVVVLDTEGGFFMTPDAFRDRLSSDVMELVDRYLAWGERPAEILREECGISAERSPVTGNPRFDILDHTFHPLYESEAADIQEKFDEFLLVNTNFSIANHYDPESTWGRYEARREYESSLLNEFVSAIKYLESDLSINILIRPHPSENHETYRQLFASSDEVFVCHEGSVRPWIYASSGVLHNSCTTGVESALMQTPTFAYEPIREPEFEIEVANAVSRRHQSYDSLRDDIHATLNNEIKHELTSQQRDTLRPYLDNLTGGAAIRIADEIETILGNQTSYSFSGDVSKYVKRMLVRTLGVKRTETLLERTTDRDYGYKQQKFPDLTATEIMSVIERYSNHVDPNAYNVNRLSDLGYVFTLTRKT